MTVVLHCADALEISHEHTGGVRPRLLLTDPPYARAGAISTGRRAANAKQSDVAGADQFWRHWFLSAVRAIGALLDPSGCGFVFTDYRTAHLVESAFAASGTGWLMTQCLVWDRDAQGMGDPFRASHELIAFVRGPDFDWKGRRNIRNVLRYPWQYVQREHPAEKPVDLLRFLVREASAPSDMVLDPFAGSGSTLLAALAEGRSGVGLELEASWCELAERRIREHEAQTSLLLGA